MRLARFVPHLFKTVLLIASYLTLTGCASNLFVNQPTNNFEKYLCAVGEPLCGLTGTDVFLHYTVEKTETGIYKIDGKVNLDVQHTGVQAWISFYILFMDQHKVVAEKRIRAPYTNGTFSVEVETMEPIAFTSLHKIEFWTRS